MEQKAKHKGNKKQKIKPLTLISFIAVAVAALILALSPKALKHINAFTNEVAGINVSQITYPCEVRFIDVGQGDCSLILSDGAAILIDSGENDKGKVVVDYLNQLNIKELDLVICTHPHSDHIGGIDVIMDSVKVKRLIMPELSDELVPTTTTYEDMLDAILKQNITPEYAKVGDKITFGKGALTILAPNGKFDDLNNSSVCAKFVYDDKASFLFTGDMEKKAEKAALKENPPTEFNADVLKSGHHGSKTSSGKAFYEAVNPKICVISVGDGNKYGLPNGEIIERYKANGAEVLRTDMRGDILIGYDEKGYHVVCAKDVEE